MRDKSRHPDSSLQRSPPNDQEDDFLSMFALKVRRLRHVVPDPSGVRRSNSDDWGIPLLQGIPTKGVCASRDGHTLGYAQWRTGEPALKRTNSTSGLEARYVRVRP